MELVWMKKSQKNIHNEKLYITLLHGTRAARFQIHYRQYDIVGSNKKVIHKENCKTKDKIDNTN